ncbi:MAG TPA: YceD family protein [Motilibacteraceae bacterium]|nr:YceD family protein [Motilibacteraceae bacterium]
MRKVSRSVPAPADLGNDVLGVPAGSDLGLELRLEAVMEGVLVTATVAGRLAGECVRCLDPLERELETTFQELYAYAPNEHAGRAGHAGEDDDDELLLLDGDYLDLEQPLRDAVVLALPLAPLCRDDCPGLCPECGARLADDPAHTHVAADPRWAALAGLVEPGPGSEGTGTTSTAHHSTEDRSTADRSTTENRPEKQEN